MTPEQLAAVACLVAWLATAATYALARLRPPVDLDSLLVVTDGRKRSTRTEIERDLMRDPAEWVREAEEAAEREHR